MPGRVGGVGGFAVGESGPGISAIVVNYNAGDLLLVSNYADGFYFGAPTEGVHGGLHPNDSEATLVFGYPGVENGRAEEMRIAVLDAIQSRCQAEGGRQASTADLLTGLLALVNQ